MKIKIKSKVETETEVDVSFPLYLGGGDSSDVSANSWDYFIRIDEDGKIWSLTVRTERASDPIEYEFSAGKIDVQRRVGRLSTAGLDVSFDQGIGVRTRC